jgi:hypothetical protein
VLHYLPHILIVLILVAAFVLAYRVEDDDPTWVERWRALSPADRTRLATAARSGTLLAEPEEIELAAGFARCDRRRRDPYNLLATIRLPLGVALLAGGLVADSGLFIFFGVIFLLGGLWGLRHSTQINRAERETIDRGRGI